VTLALLAIALVACPAGRKNHAPEAQDRFLTTTEDTSLDFTLDITDPDDGDTHTYSLASGTGDDNNHRFTLTSNELRTAEALDHETTPTLTIRIHSQDQHGLGTERAITITVSDVNEPPSSINLDPTTFAENHPPDSLVGWLTTADPDASDQHAYALVEGAGDNDNASFGIDGTNALVNTRAFDYEATTSLSVRVASTDQGGLRVEQAITIAISDVDEAPTVAMIRQVGSSDTDEALGVAVDANGDLFIGGYTTGSLHGEPSVGGEDMVLVKYRANGPRQWTRQTGSTANERVNGIASDGGLNVYMTGWTAGSMHGESLSGTTDFFLVKYNGLGNRLWTRLHGSSAGDGPRNLTVDAQGNVYVTGYTWNAMDGNSFAGGGDLFVTKYDSDGTRLWKRQRGTPNWDEGNSVVTDASGNVYVVGVTQGSLDGHSSAGDRDIFIVKYDASGNWQWTRQFGSVEEEVAMDVTVDGDGNLFLAGWTAGAIDEQANYGNNDAVIAKYQPNGARLWIRTPGTSADDRAYTVTTGTAGHAYVSANTLGTLGEQGNFGSWVVAVLRYDQDGLLQGARQFGTPSSDRVLESATGPMNRIYATGATASDLLEGAHIGGLDIFFVELAP